MRSAHRASIAVLWLVLASLGMAARAEPADAPLGPDEAFLLVRFVMVYDPQMGKPPRLRFGRVGSSDELVVFRQSPLQVLRVPAGRYYLKSAESGIYDSTAVVNSEPEDPSRTLDVAAGSVVYIGDYVFDERRRLSQRYTRDSLVDAQANTALHAYPLKVAKVGAPTQTLAWQ